MKSSEVGARRFVILQTGDVSSDLRDAYLDYPSMFLRLLTAAGMAPEQFSTIDARSEPLPSAVTADAYLITGSAHSVYDDLPWIASLADFVEQVLAAGRPVVGICFGHQLLAHFFGGRVALSDKGWRVGVEHYQLVSQPAWLALPQDPPPQGFSILVSHQDQVQSLPRNAQWLAKHPQCEFAAFTMSYPGGGQALAVQGHPEFDKGYLEALLLERRNRLGEAVFSRGTASLVESTTSDLVGGWIKCFLELPASESSHE